MFSAFYRKFLVFSLMLIFITPLCYGQKVAVVLSGGGSKGAAHAGVLKALEENNIQIDYIIGTSIGAFVGALYASGYSPEEIENFFISTDLKRWSSGESNPKFNYFFKMDEPDPSWVNFDFSFKTPLTKILPTSLVPTTEMDFTLMSLFAEASAASNQNFDSLFIPFRCIAADIDSDKALTLSNGDLGAAVRASITFPLFFKPIKIDDRLLFDGGMYNNFPHDVAMDVFKPDLIIGSNVSKNYPSPDPDDVVSQLQKMLMTDADFNLSKESGIIIQPKVSRPNLTDFSLSQEFIQLGYDETIRRMPEIKERIKDFRKDGETNELRNKFKAKFQPLFIDSISNAGLTKNESAYFKKQLFHEYNTITLAEVETGYYNIATDGYFKVSMPLLKPNATRQKYTLDLGLKRSDRFNVKFGGNLSSRLANVGFVELNYKHLSSQGFKLKTNVFVGRFHSSVLLGFKLESPSKPPFYLDANLVYNHFDFFKSTIHFFEDITPSYLISNENYVRVTAGAPTNIKGKFEANITLGSMDNNYYQSNMFTRLDTADKTTFNFSKTAVRWELNTLNRKQYANAGARFLLEATLINGKENFYSGSLTYERSDLKDIKHKWVSVGMKWENYFTKPRKLKFGFYSEVSLTTQRFFSNYTSSLLMAPAFFKVPESQTIFLPNYRAFSYGVGGLITIFTIAKNFDFRFENYIFQPYRQIFSDKNYKSFFGEKFKNRYLMSSAVLVYNSKLTPISISLNYFDNPEEKFFFSFNIGYLIFNKRALY
jgi:NTE family protein